MQIIIESAKESMDSALKHLEREMLNIRAGKANPIMLSGVKVEYYGHQLVISQVAILIHLTSKTLSNSTMGQINISDVENAIMTANIGFNPMNNGESIIINIPALTEERRKELVKIAKSETENAKVSIRSARKELNTEIKKSETSEDVQKNFEIDIQTLTDEFISRADEIFSLKEKEILTI